MLKTAARVMQLYVPVVKVSSRLSPDQSFSSALELNQPAARATALISTAISAIVVHVIRLSVIDLLP